MKTFREQYRECKQNRTTETVNCEPFVLYSILGVKLTLENYQYCKRFNDTCGSETCKHLREGQL
jgi:hypothetical protein